MVPVQCDVVCVLFIGRKKTSVGVGTTNAYTVLPVLKGLVVKYSQCGKVEFMMLPCFTDNNSFLKQILKTHTYSAKMSVCPCMHAQSSTRIYNPKKI